MNSPQPEHKAGLRRLGLAAGGRLRVVVAADSSATNDSPRRARQYNPPMHHAKNQRLDWGKLALTLSLLVSACSAPAYAVNPTRAAANATTLADSPRPLTL